MKDYKWIIRCISNHNLYWNNDYGWGDYEGRQVFPAGSTCEFNLPIDGEWVKV